MNKSNEEVLNTPSAGEAPMSFEELWSDVRDAFDDDPDCHNAASIGYNSRDPEVTALKQELAQMREERRLLYISVDNLENELEEFKSLPIPSEAIGKGLMELIEVRQELAQAKEALRKELELPTHLLDVHAIADQRDRLVDELAQAKEEIVQANEGFERLEEKLYASVMTVAALEGKLGKLGEMREAGDEMYRDINILCEHAVASQASWNEVKASLEPIKKEEKGL